ncbi:MAG: SNF2 helicase associated domain-containing protein [Roseburia sp.]|nr:SNF2 helicase associated domain-containing protein [Roseburia sp.]
MVNWRNYFASSILERGRTYQKKGMVQCVEENNGKYTAEVIGTVPYQVSVWKKLNGQLGMSCTCPYAKEGKKCKHMAALCMEIGEHLSDIKVPYENRQKIKPVNVRVYPFSQKNKTKNERYTYFDLSVITKDMVIMQEQWESAKKMVEDGEVTLQNVEIGYREQYQGKPEQGGTVNAFYNGSSGSVPVTIYFSKDAILSAQCAVPKCGNYYYQGYYLYAKKQLCTHQLAALLLLSDYIEKYNPGDTTDYEALLLMKRYNQMNHRQIVGTMNEIAEDLHLEPKLEHFFESLKLSFRAGTSKLYVVKNLTDFVENVEEKRVQKFGSKTEIDFAVHRMHEDSWKYYSFIRKIVREEQRRNWINRRYSYDDREIEGSILLYGSRLDEFYELLKEENAEINYVDKTVDAKGKRLTVGEGNPKVQLKISEKFDKNKVFKGIEVRGHCPDILKGESSIYFIENEVLKRIEQDAARMLEPLFEMAEIADIEFEVGRKSLADFYYHTMPLLGEYVEFVENKASVVEKYLPPKAEFCFYLDAEKEGITCDAKVSYGKDTYALFDRLSKHVEADEVQDMEAESDAVFHVTRYFSEVDVQRGLFYCKDEPEAVFGVLEHGISELLTIGEVFCTDRLKNINVQKKTPLKVGVSLESGIMNLEISSEEFSNQELLEILASYRKKKRYHRLKNGDFLNIEDENLEILNGMIDTLHISSKEFLKGNIKIPAYRALYLDKLLEKNDSLYVDRDKHFKSLIKEFKTVSDSDFEVPAAMQKTLRNYQMEGYRWLRTLDAYGFGGILADDMGLGKTLQVITVLQAAKNEGRTGTSLVVSPASLVYNWQEEFRRFAPGMKTLVVAGMQGERVELLKNYKEYDVLITSYDLLKRDIAAYEDLQFDFQIIDEAQYIKNHTTAAAKAVKGINSQTKYALTGTPIENRLSELWSIFDYLMPGFLYGYETFRKEMELPVTKNKDSGAVERLKKMVSPFIMRRLKQDVLKDLPDKLEEIQYARFEAKQQQIYDGQVVHMKEMLAKQSKEEFAQNKLQVLAELTKLRQICCDPTLLFENYSGESAKRQACIDLMKSAIEGEHRILLFSQFTSMLELLEESLKKEGIDFYKITGVTPKEERIRLVKQFNEGTIPVFLISLKAGGTGLNLTGADVVIHYDPWWNQAVQNQATDRAHRIGQKKVVTVYKLIMKDSIEEKIMHLQDAKKNLADEILSGENGGLAQMSKEDLLALL